MLLLAFSRVPDSMCAKFHLYTITFIWTKKGWAKTAVPDQYLESYPDCIKVTACVLNFWYSVLLNYMQWLDDSGVEKEFIFQQMLAFVAFKAFICGYQWEIRFLDLLASVFQPETYKVPWSEAFNQCKWIWRWIMETLI